MKEQRETPHKRVPFKTWNQWTQSSASYQMAPSTLFTIQQAFIKLEIILGPMCHLSFFSSSFFPSFWKMNYLSPAALTPTQTQEEYHLTILFHPCVLQKIAIKGPPRPSNGRLYFLSCLHDLYRNFSPLFCPQQWSQSRMLLINLFPQLTYHPLTSLFLQELPFPILP